jgi:hypothetical protein
MRIPRPLPSAAVLLSVVLATSVAAAVFVEDFSSMPADECLPDGSEIGAWTFVFDGYGCSGFVASNGNTMLLLQPMGSSSAGETHGALVIGPPTSGDVTLEVSTATLRQLRTGSTPNPWEVGWVLWHVVDTAHFYYFAAKPNGWELGKADPAYPGSQRFLATGSWPAFPIGPWYRVRVTHTGGTIQVFVDDLLLTTFTDGERPYATGRLGLYSEDAEAYFDDVSVTTSDARPKRGKGRKAR